jgi:hypothetical protein
MPPKKQNNGSSNGSKPSSPAQPPLQQKAQPAAAAAPAKSPSSPVAPSSPVFQIPKASPIANYKDDELTERQKFLLSKMANLKLYKPKELPPPRLNRNRSWLAVLHEKYNIETALYMLEPWERWLLNTMLVLFFVLLGYWAHWLYTALHSFDAYTAFVEWISSLKSDFEEHMRK